MAQHHNRVSDRPATDVLIVGGGVVALAIAESLASEGAAVRLIEAEAVGSGASGAAAGMLAPIAEARLGEAAVASGVESLRLGLESLKRFDPLCQRLREETGIDPEFERSGRLELAEHGPASDRLRARKEEFETAARGFDPLLSSSLELCDRKAIESFEGCPDERFTTGIYSHSEAHVRPPLLVRALASAARQRGARIDSGVRAHGLRRAGDRVLGVESSEGMLSAGLTVMAAGVSTPALLGAEIVARGGIEIAPVRGQILSLEAPLPAMKTICWADDVYFVPKRDGSWVVGATEERVGFDRRVTASGVHWLLSRAARVFPDLGNASFGTAWAGLRPVSRDGRAYVGPIPGLDGLIIASGHGRNGVLLAPVTAQIVCDLWQGKASGTLARTLYPGSSRAPAI